MERVTAPTRVIVAEDDVLLGVPARISESDQELRASGVSG
jgi:hypothetical protein